MKAGYVNTLLQRARRSVSMPRPQLVAVARAPRYEVSDVADAPARPPAARAIDRAASVRAERARAWDTAMRIATTAPSIAARHAGATAPPAHAPALWPQHIERDVVIERGNAATAFPPAARPPSEPHDMAGDARTHRFAPMQTEIDTACDDRIDAQSEALPATEMLAPMRPMQTAPDTPAASDAPGTPLRRADLPERLIVHLPADQPPLTGDVRASLEQQVRRAARQALRENASVAALDGGPRHVEVNVGRVEVNVAAPAPPAPMRTPAASAGDASMRVLARRLSGW